MSLQSPPLSPQYVELNVDHDSAERQSFHVHSDPWAAALEVWGGPVVYSGAHNMICSATHRLFLLLQSYLLLIFTH